MIIIISWLILFYPPHWTGRVEVTIILKSLNLNMTSRARKESIQELNELYEKLKMKQISLTTNYIYMVMRKHKTQLDLSNKCMFDTCIFKLRALINKSYGPIIPIKSLILQNCMLTASAANAILMIFLNFPGRIYLSSIDLGNNSVDINVGLANTLCRVLGKSDASEHKSIILKGNIITDTKAFDELMQFAFPLRLLSLYDCFLRPEILLSLSEALSSNKNIQKVDLSYNPSAFVSKAITNSFGLSIGLNTHLESLILNGNTTLNKKSILRKLSLGLKHSSLRKLIIGNIPLNDLGINIIRKNCLSFMNIEHLDIQNNKISSNKFIKLINNLPIGLVKLIACYNSFDDNKVLAEIGKSIKNQKFLRVFDISYCFIIETIDPGCMSLFCNGIIQNRSLVEFVCEGCKIQNHPDLFCKQLSEAIEARKYPISFKISSAKDCDNQISHYLSKTQERILKDISFN
jgi:uncharacterized protein YejL (UPF0352 family)